MTLIRLFPCFVHESHFIQKHWLCVLRMSLVKKSLLPLLFKLLEIPRCYGNYTKKVISFLQKIQTGELIFHQELVEWADRKDEKFTGSCKL